MRVFLSLLAAMALSASGIAQISTFPHQENFNSWPLGTALQGGWSQFIAPADQNDWTVDDLGTTSAPTGPVGDAPSHGAGRYVYFETSGPVAGAQAHMRSPDFDISAIPGAVLQFWYHMCGVDCANLFVDVWDPVAMAYVNKLTLNGPQHAAETTPWTRSAPLPFAPITGITHVRFRAVRGASFLGDSAVDLFEIYDASAPNMAVLSIDAPSTGCALTAAETVSVTVSNLSSNPAVNVPIQYTIAGPTPVGPVAELIPMVPAFSGPVSFSFATTVDLLAPGFYDLTVDVMIPGDSNPANDSGQRVLGSGAGKSLPMDEDFEGGANGWVVRGAGSFQLGTPAGTVIIGPPPGGGVNSWDINLTGGYTFDENVWVESPDFPFCDMTMPEVQLDVWWNCEFSWDGAVLQSSVDGGTTWQNIGTQGSGTNWYTDGTIAGLPGGQQTGWTGRNSTGNGSVTWVRATNVAPALAGVTGRVRVAFGSDGTIQDDGFAWDNILIRQQGLTTAYDTGASSPPSPIMAGNNDLGVVAVQFTMSATVGSDFVRSVDLVASGAGDDVAGVTNVAVWREDPSSTNGLIDGLDSLVFSGVYPMDDGTLVATLGQSLAMGTTVNFLVAYDLSATASGATPPGIYIVTVNNPQVAGTITPPAANPTGTIEVNPCLAMVAYDTGAQSPVSPVTAVDSDTDVVAVQFSVTSTVEADTLAALDLVPSGSGNDATDVTQVHVWLEDPATTNGVVDAGTDTQVFSGVYAADDTTMTVPMGVALNLGTTYNFLVAYDFSATASGAAPPALFSVVVTNLDVCGVITPPLADPMGTISVGLCRTSVCGDCLVDGNINILDALRAAQTSAGLVSMMPMTEEFANCNVQGLVEPDPGAAITILDALSMAQFAAGLPALLTCC